MKTFITKAGKRFIQQLFMEHKRINKMYVEFSETAKDTAETADFTDSAAHQEGSGFVVLPVSAIGIDENAQLTFSGAYKRGSTAYMHGTPTARSFVTRVALVYGPTAEGKDDEVIAVSVVNDTTKMLTDSYLTVTCTIRIG